MEEKEYDPDEADENASEPEGKEELLEDAEISPEEEGFLKGYEEADSEE